MTLGELGVWTSCAICRVPGVQPSGSPPFFLLLGAVVWGTEDGGSACGVTESRGALLRQRTQENFGHTAGDTVLKWGRRGKRGHQRSCAVWSECRSWEVSLLHFWNWGVCATSKWVLQLAETPRFPPTDHLPGTGSPGPHWPCHHTGGCRAVPPVWACSRDTP